MSGDPLPTGFQTDANYWSLKDWPTPEVFKIETEEEKRKRLFKEKVESLSQADLLQELLIASNTARKTRDMEKYRVNRKRKNKAAARSRAKNR